MVIEIHNEEDLDKLRDTEHESDKEFVLKDDIEISGEWTPIENFYGDLDGNWHTISGVHVETDSSRAGFMESSSDAEIKNLALTDVDILSTYDGSGVTSANVQVGGLVGALYTQEVTTPIENVFVSGKVEAPHPPDENFQYDVGGITGRFDGFDTYIKHCVFNGEIYGGNRGGGIAGRTIHTSSIHDCYAEGSVTGYGGEAGGGVVGHTSDWTTDPWQAESEILRSFSAVDVSGYSSYNGMIAGFTTAVDEIEDCYYNEKFGSSDRAEGLTTDQMQGMDNPPEFMDDLHFSEGRNKDWVTREDDYPAPAQLPTEVIEIHNQEELNQLRELAGFFVLRDDIELEYEPGGIWYPVGHDTDEPFIGTFDGLGYEISNLYVAGFEYYGGFFEEISNAEVRNVYISGNIFSDHDLYAGGLAGVDRGGSTIERVYFSGQRRTSLRGSYGYCGGLIGKITGDGTHIRVSATDGVTRSYYSGGLVGGLDAEATIHDCYSVGTIFDTVYGSGLVGYVTGGPLEMVDVYSAVDSDWDMMVWVSDDTYDHEIAGYYDDDIGDSTNGEGLTTEQMQGTENPPEFMEMLDFSEDGVWTTREDDYPTFNWLVEEEDEDEDIPEDVLRILRGGYSSKRLSVGRKFHGHGTGTSMRM